MSQRPSFILPYTLAQMFEHYGVFLGTLVAPLSFPEHVSPNVEVAIPFGNAHGPATWQSATGRRTTALIHSAYTSIIPANQPHSGLWERTAEVLVVYFTPQYFWYVDDRIEADTPIDMIEGATLIDPFLRQLGDAVHHELNTVGRIAPLYAGSMAHLMAVHLLRCYTVRRILSNSLSIQPKKVNRTIQQALDYIHAHLDQPLSIMEVARSTGVSEGHLRRLFRASLKQSPQHYIVDQRIARAKHLLVQSTRSIAEVAAASGFVDAAHFSHVFRRRVGVSPSLYRKQV